jgi:DHA3 family tetracycline resistance protein-like MFS transporter
LSNRSLVSRLRFARALGSSSFALVWSGQTISALGDGVTLTALAWQVLVMTRSGAAMGAVLVAETVPRVLLLLLGGVVADRFSRRNVLVWSDTIRGVAIGAIAVLGWMNLLALWHLIVLGAIFGLASAFFSPAYQSIPTQLVKADDLPSANALNGMSRQMSQLFGPALGAALVALSSPSAAFAIDAASFGLSAVLLLAVHLPPLPKGTDDEAIHKRGPRGMVADIREGLGYVLRSPWLWVTIAIASLGNVGLAPMQVALPKLIKDVYGQDVWLLGATGTAIAAGSLVTMLLIGQARRLHRRGILAYGGLIISSIAVIILGLPLPHQYAPAVAISVGVFFGAGLAVFELIWVTTLQELVPAEKLGRVSSVDWVGSLALLPIGLAVVGVLTDRVGASWVFVAGGTLNLLLELIALAVPGIRNLD